MVFLGIRTPWIGANPQDPYPNFCSQPLFFYVASFHGQFLLAIWTWWSLLWWKTPIRILSWKQYCTMFHTIYFICVLTSKEQILQSFSLCLLFSDIVLSFLVHNHYIWLFILSKWFYLWLSSHQVPHSPWFKFALSSSCSNFLAVLLGS